MFVTVRKVDNEIVLRMSIGSEFQTLGALGTNYKQRCLAKKIKFSLKFCVKKGLGAKKFIKEFTNKKWSLSSAKKLLVLWIANSHASLRNYPECSLNSIHMVLR